MPVARKPDTILVLDFGGQYCHLITRRIREFNVYSEILPSDVTLEELKETEARLNVKGLVFSGGPSSVYDEGAPTIELGILGLDVPLLGLCYGHQLLARLLGGKVKRGVRQEYGITHVAIVKPVGVLKGLDCSEKVWMSHGDIVKDLAEEFEVLASTDNSPIAAFRHKEKPIYGLQWHPEVVHTRHGERMLRNFVFEVCGCQPNWKPASVVDEQIDKMKRIVGNGKAIIALSGGIDSGTAALIAAKALGRRLTAVFVDHGFMREGEPEFVKTVFGELGVKVTVVEASERFFRRLKGVADPEEKRRIIGNEFVRVFEEAAHEIGAEYLIQGTIYPDRIESGFRKHSDKIKSHHNVAGLPIDIEFKAVIEPLKDLYKDEVRKLAKTLGLPGNIVKRQPFPGPGLAVRVVGEVTPEKVDIARKADRIVSEEVEKADFEHGLWQYFAVVTDTKSTGVKGDARAYGYVVAVRMVESREAMTASFAKASYELLERISTRITNEIPAVSRVVYDVTHKPPATIEWE